MLRKLLISATSVLFVTTCVSVPDPGSPRGEVGDVCTALAKVHWTDDDADHVSEVLARSLDRVLQMEEEHGCE